MEKEHPDGQTTYSFFHRGLTVTLTLNTPHPFFENSCGEILQHKEESNMMFRIVSLSLLMASAVAFQAHLPVRSTPKVSDFGEMPARVFIRVL